MIFLNKTLKKNDFQKNGFITPFYRFDKFKILIIITLGTIVLQEEMMNKEHVKETMDVQIKGDRMQYLVLLVITLVVIAYILDGRRKKQPLSIIDFAFIVFKCEKGRLEPSLFIYFDFAPIDIYIICDKSKIINMEEVIL